MLITFFQHDNRRRWWRRELFTLARCHGYGRGTDKGISVDDDLSLVVHSHIFTHTHTHTYTHMWRANVWVLRLKTLRVTFPPNSLSSFSRHLDAHALGGEGESNINGVVVVVIL